MGTPTKKKTGRPKAKTSNGKDKYDPKIMTSKVEKYIEEKKRSVPILKECCLLNDWDYDYVMKLQRKEEYAIFRQSIKKLLDWKEVRLEQGALSGQIDKTMAIFSLKQPCFGWTDKPQEDNSEILDKLDDVLERIKE